MWGEIGSIVGSSFAGQMLDRGCSKTRLTAFMIASSAVITAAMCGAVYVCTTTYVLDSFGRSSSNYVANSSNMSASQSVVCMDNTCHFSFRDPSSVADGNVSHHDLLLYSVWRWAMHPAVVNAGIFILHLSANGPKMLLQLALMDSVPKEWSGTAGGLYGLASQLGSVVSGVGIAYAVGWVGWRAVPAAFAIASAVTVMTLIMSERHSDKSPDSEKVKVRSSETACSCSCAPVKEKTL